MTHATLARKAGATTAANAKTASQNASGNLRIGEPDDAFEREAESVADRVMSATPGKLDWSLSKMSFGGRLKREASAYQAATQAGTMAPPIVHEVLRSPGQPLDPGTRGFMEEQFGHDFSNVRIHIDSKAAESARSIHARAYAVCNKIAFDTGNYAPQTAEGKQLLAHELTHTLQQSAPAGRVQRAAPSFEKLDQQYQQAVESGDWVNAARILNGFQRSDISTRLGKLKPDQIASLHQAALQIVGADSQLAQMTGAKATASKKSFKATTADLDHLADLMTQLGKLVDAKTRQTLIMYKTVAIGLVVDNDGDPTTVYSTSGDWTNQSLRTAMEKLGIQRCEPGGGKRARGKGGAPGDAEQLLLEAAETNNFSVKAMAVSQGICLDCQEAIKNNEGETIMVRVVRIAKDGEKSADSGKALGELQDYFERLTNALNSSHSEHVAEARLITDPSFSGFAGYWTNRLFNRDIPGIIIWNKAFVSMARAEACLKRKKLAEALSHLLEARIHYLAALKNYTNWKSGVEGAGVKMQVAIGAVAVVTVVLVTGPAIVAALGEAGGEASEAAETLDKIRVVTEQADKVFEAVDAAEEAASVEEIERMAEIERDMELVQSLRAF